MLKQDCSHITLSLCVTHQDTIPGWLGRAMQAIYLHAMEAISPEVSLAIHDGSNYHPYTVSDVLPIARAELRELKRGQTLTVILTTLHHQVTQLTLNSVLPEWIDRGIDLHGQRVTITHADVMSASFDDLLARHAENRNRRVVMRFLTPTSTKRSRARTDTNERRESQIVPLPVPERVFASLFDRWNHFAPQPLPAELKTFIDQELTLQHCSIRTHVVDRQRANKGSTVGFVGEATFYCESSQQPWIGYLNALAAFAPFSGVGIKTTQGMGTVQLLAQSERTTLS
ncbi:CRISPR system precrRNA processing endoribonuclease RAMP protein Cas6 [Aggregatilineales bacterium SYSU G02658]